MSIKNTHCDYCKNELKSPPKTKKDKSGLFYSVDSEYYFPFVCPFCGGHFCTKHRLPENHECKDFPRSYRNTAHISTKLRDFDITHKPEIKKDSSGKYVIVNKTYKTSLLKRITNKIKKKRV